MKKAQNEEMLDSAVRKLNDLKFDYEKKINNVNSSMLVSPESDGLSGRKDTISTAFIKDIFSGINVRLDSIIQGLYKKYYFDCNVDNRIHQLKIEIDQEKWTKIYSGYCLKRDNLNDLLQDQVKQNRWSKIFIVSITVFLWLCLLALSVIIFLNTYIILALVLIVIFGAIILSSTSKLYNNNKEEYELIYKEYNNNMHCAHREMLQSVSKEMLAPAIEAIRPQVLKEITKFRSTFIDLLWDFKTECDAVLSGFDALPSKIASTTSNMLFEYHFEEDLCRQADNPEVDEEILNNRLKQYVEIRKPVLEKNIVESFHDESKTIIRHFAETITKNGKKIESAGAISKGKIDELVAGTLNRSSQSFEISDNTEGLTNMIIAGGVIGAGVLSGGAGVALIAAGPIGWITGAIIGGALLLGGKGMIKSFLRSLGFGLNSGKMQKQLSDCQSQFNDQIRKSLSPECDKLRKNLETISIDIIKKLIMQNNPNQKILK